MADDLLFEPGLPPPVRTPAPRLRLAATAAFVLGAGAAGWVGWLCGADFAHFGLNVVGGRPPATASGAARLPAANDAQAALHDGWALTGRVAALEQRLDRLDLRVVSASGNAARAEALLVAFAVRRVVERGAPLGYLGDQLKLRFGDAQPRAVATIVNGAREMESLGQLAARLEVLAPQLTDSGRQTLWSRVSHELSELLVVRRDRPALSEAHLRFDDARKALSEGRIDDAVADVQHLSNSADAANWTAAARRYRDVENALDLIDTTALLQPRQLHDGVGNAVNAGG